VRPVIGDGRDHIHVAAEEDPRIRFGRDEVVPPARMGYDAALHPERVEELSYELDHIGRLPGRVFAPDPDER